MDRVRHFLWGVGISLLIAIPQGLTGQGTPIAAGADGQAEPPPVLDRRAGLVLTEVALGEALVRLYDASGVPVSFSPSLLPDRTVSCACAELSIAAALDHMLAGTGLLYRAIAGHVIVYRVLQSDIRRALPTVETRYASLAPLPVLRLPEQRRTNRAAVIVGVVREQASGDPVANAQVAVDGSGRTFTDVEGRYRIGGVTPGSRRVSVRSIGYREASQTVEVGDGRTAVANFQLEINPSQLEEIVATVTGEQRVRELGHVVGRIDADSLVREAPISTVAELLNARVPGLQVFTSSGSVGGSVSLRVRGATTVHLSQDPIVIVDGVRYTSGFPEVTQSPWGVEPTSRLNDLNPNDIATVEVAKGPSAAALYGTDAANGVIVITTKQGQAGPAQWNAYVRSGFNEIPEYRHPDVYWGWGSATNSCLLREVVSGACTQDSVSVIPNPLNDAALTIFDSKPHYQYGANVSGGGEGLTYFLSADLEDATGPIRLPPYVVEQWRDMYGGRELPEALREPNKQNKLNLRSNITARLSETAIVRVNAAYTQAETRQASFRGPYNDGTSRMGPSTEPYGRSDPLSAFSQTSTETIDRFTGGASGEWAPVSWLQARASAGLDLISGYRYSLLERTEDEDGQIGDDRTRTLVATAEAGGTVRKTVGRISSRTSIGAQYVRNMSDNVITNGNDLRPGGASVVDAANRYSYHLFNETASLGSYIEQTVGLNDRLFLTGAVRADGASTFGNNYKAAFYPKWGISWIASEEPFLPRVPGVEELRVRYAYGSSGQQPEPSMRNLELQSAQGIVNGSTEHTVEVYRLANPNLRPERVREHEFGFDVGALGGLLQLGLTWNRRETVDQISLISLPTGIGRLWTNIGLIESEGFEALVSAHLFDTPLASLDLLLSHATTTDVLRDIGDATEYRRKEGSLAEGYPIGARFMRPLLGYEDVNGDGIIAVDELVMGDSAVYIGRGIPGTTQALTTTLGLAQQRIRFSALIERRSDFVQYDRLATRSQLGARAAVDPTTPLEDQAEFIAGYTPVPVGGDAGGRYGPVYDGTFMRLREASLSLDIPSRFLTLAHTDRATLSITGRNLALWTRYKGPDPESAQVQGISGGEAEYLPHARSWTVRFDVGF